VTPNGTKAKEQQWGISSQVITKSTYNVGAMVSNEKRKGERERERERV
jgi:hypothetical protein